MVCLQESLRHTPRANGKITDEVLTEILSGDDDDFLGLDHVDRTRSMRNGTGDLFLK